MVGEIEPGPALEVVRQAALACTRCPLAATRTQVVFGRGDPTAQVLLVGEAPGADEDRDGRPFVGQAGHELASALVASGLDRRAVYITNAVKCQPPGNRRPTPEELEACRPWLDLELLVIRPTVVVGLGITALHRLIDPDGARIADHDEESRLVSGAQRLVTYHPSPRSLNTNPGRRTRLVGTLTHALELLTAESPETAQR